MHMIPIMKIFVRTMNGKTITLEVQSSHTIDSVKKRIKDIKFMPADIPLHRLKLVFRGKMLMEGGRTLADYNIEKESTLHLAVGMEQGENEESVVASSVTGLGFNSIF